MQNACVQRAFSIDACCQTCSHNGSSPMMNLVQMRATIAHSTLRNSSQRSDLCQASTGQRTGQTAHKSAPSPSLCGHAQGTAVEVAWRSKQPLSALDLRDLTIGGVVPAQTMIAGRSFTVALGVDTLAVCTARLALPIITKSVGFYITRSRQPVVALGSGLCRVSPGERGTRMRGGR